MPFMTNYNDDCPLQADGRVIAESPLAMAYVARQVWRNIYCSDKGLLRGTIFAELDLPFKGGACCDKATALMNVLEEGFALDDALLYLDTHPDDDRAQCFYQEHQQAYHMAYDAYVAQFGPLQLDDLPQTDCSAWVSTPWPWEMEA